MHRISTNIGTYSGYKHSFVIMLFHLFRATALAILSTKNGLEALKTDRDSMEAWKTDRDSMEAWKTDRDSMEARKTSPTPLQLLIKDMPGEKCLHFKSIFYAVHNILVHVMQHL